MFIEICIFTNVFDSSDGKYHCSYVLICMLKDLRSFDIDERLFFKFFFWFFIVFCNLSTILNNIFFEDDRGELIED